jgi:predicted AlkP superfamily phosphohydrolase/phosphomutase
MFYMLSINDIYMSLFDRLKENGANERVAFIGIDGVPYSLIMDNPDRFQNICEIAEDGCSKSIDSIVPPESSACWPALTTGVNPGSTGVYGFMDREIASYDTYVPLGSDVQSGRIWDKVTDEGMNASVINVPVTFPPERNTQRMVTGFLSPELEKSVRPKSFVEDLKSLDYRIDVDAKLGHKDDKEEFIQDCYKTLESRYSAFKKCIQVDDWDLFFGVFMTPDRINHFLYGDYVEDGEYKDEFLSFYEKLDTYIGKVRDSLADDVTLIIASDHGFTKLDYEVHMNEWLKRNNFLSYDGENHDSLEDISEDTEFYSFIPGRFYLNLEGREPNGCIPEEDYDTARERLKNQLNQMVGPDGRSVCSRVVEKEDVFSGEHTEIAPDLVAIPNDGFDLKSGFGESEEIFDVDVRNGMHSFDNTTFVSNSNNIEFLDNTNILDIMPTMLDMMDISYNNENLDGRSLIK